MERGLLAVTEEGLKVTWEGAERGGMSLAFEGASDVVLSLEDDSFLGRYLRFCGGIGASVDNRFCGSSRSLARDGLCSRSLVRPGSVEVWDVVVVVIGGRRGGAVEEVGLLNLCRIYKKSNYHHSRATQYRKRILLFINSPWLLCQCITLSLHTKNLVFHREGFLPPGRIGICNILTTSWDHDTEG